VDGSRRVETRSSWVLTLEDVGVEHDRASGHRPRAVHLPQQILAAAGQELMIRLQVRTVHQKRGLGLHLHRSLAEPPRDCPPGNGYTTGNPRPRPSGVEPGYPHIEIELVLLEDRQIAERRQLAVRLPAGCSCGAAWCRDRAAPCACARRASPAVTEFPAHAHEHAQPENGRNGRVSCGQAPERPGANTNGMVDDYNL
jgi:hypothetical protein